MSSRSALVLALSLLAACGTDTLSTDDRPSTRREAQEEAEGLLLELKEEAGTDFALEVAGGRVVGLQLAHPVDPSVDGFRAALEELDPVLGLAAVDGLEAFVLREERREDTGTLHMAFGLARGGVVVHDAELVLHAIGEELVAIDVHLPDLGTLAEPAERILTPQEATAHALSLALQRYEEVELVGEPQQRIAGPRHVWQTALEVVGEEAAGTLFVQVDATTGAVVGERLRPVMPHVDFEVYDVSGESASRCWEDQWFFDPVCDQDRCDSGAPVESWSARYHTEESMDWLWETFRRDGIDRWGGEQVAHVLAPMPASIGNNNAYYSPACDHVAFSPGMVEQEVVAHEWGHGLLNKEGIDYTPGTDRAAIHEHMGDMYAMYYERWQDGTDLDFVLGSFGNTQVRDLVNNLQVDHTGSQTGSDHANSQLLSYAVMLLTQGGVHQSTGVTVDAVDADKVLHILHRNVVDNLGARPTYGSYRRGLITEARAARWSSHEICQLGNAMGSVGIGTIDQDCDLIPDGLDWDDDGDSIGDGSDNCPQVPNGLQADLDGDGIGDACDDDLDGDGVDNVRDNCIDAPNTTQSDRDGDGTGDACDDSDRDGHADGLDNCPDDVNRAQTDLDGDGVGDVCDDDVDGDHVPDSSDNCPWASNPWQQDFDGDDRGDACDDSDGDGFFDDVDRCPETPDRRDPDLDDDGRWDSCADEDDDDDDIPDVEDNCPVAPNPEQVDTDEDGIGDACDACPEDENSHRDLDDDGLDDACDPYFDWREPVPEVDIRCLYWGCDGQPSYREVEIAIWAGEHFDVLPELPLPTCTYDCPEVYGDDWTVTVSTFSELPYGLAVVDQHGDIVARAEGTDGESALSFRPAPSTPQGTHAYRLVVRPLSEGMPVAGPMEVSVTAGSER